MFISYVWDSFGSFQSVQRVLRTSLKKICTAEVLKVFWLMIHYITLTGDPLMLSCSFIFIFQSRSEMFSIFLRNIATAQTSLASGMRSPGIIFYLRFNVVTEKIWIFVGAPFMHIDAFTLKETMCIRFAWDIVPFTIKCSYKQKKYTIFFPFHAKLSKSDLSFDSFHVSTRGVPWYLHKIESALSFFSGSF